MTTTKKPRVQRVKMRAVQRLENNLTLVEEGEVFIFEGDELPHKDIAERVDADTPLGIMPEQPKTDPLKESPPSWTTPGFVKGQTREQGRRDVDVDDLLD